MTNTDWHDGYEVSPVKGARCTILYLDAEQHAVCEQPGLSRRGESPVWRNDNRCLLYARWWKPMEQVRKLP